MSQKHIKTTPHKIDTAKLSATLNNSLVIRLVIASVIFAVSLILSMPEFVCILLLVLGRRARRLRYHSQSRLTRLKAAITWTRPSWWF